MQKRRMVFLLLAVLSLAALLTGCGSSSEENLPPATGVVFTGTPIGINNCTTCHTVLTTAWMKSKHANAEGGLTSAGSPILSALVDQACKDCHDKFTDSGGLGGYTGATRPVVGCESCHGGGSEHNGSGPISRLASVSTPTNYGSVTASPQFQTCNACHGLLDTTTGGATTAVHSAATATSPTGNAYVITDTHFATYLTTFGSNTPLTGYAMDYSSPRVCIDCHDPHGVTTINQDWQKSAHADIYGGDKGYTRAAWARSNWSCDATSTAGACTATGGVADRRYCQRCHTTDGFIAFADALRTGDTEQALKLRQADLHFTFSAGTYTPLTSAVSYTTAGWKPQMLKCNACHTDYKGTLRNPGPFPAVYDFYSVSKLFTGPVVSVFVKGVNQQYPDVLGSNICVACHSGRESGETIVALNSDATLSTFDFTNKAYFTPHELTGAGTVFTATGFEYAGRSYENNTTYRHENIGTPKEPGTGSNGPCVGCHMSRPNKNGNHLFMPVSRAFIDPAGSFVSKQAATITGIASEVCFNCHGPNDNVILDMVIEQKLLYAEAIEAVARTLEFAGYFWNEGSYRQRDGTVLRSGAGGAAVTFNSTIVTAVVNTGSSFTNWLNLNIAPGDQFRIDTDSASYTVATVDTATQLTLSSPYAGASATGRYTITKPADVVSTDGSAVVTGLTASWIVTGVTASTGVSAADHFRVDSDGTWYQIVSRTANTLTLATPYTGPDVTGANYSIRKFRNNANQIVNWLTPPDTDVNGNGTGKNNMGAAFNVYILESDPAGYVHNRYYMKRLMYDTIDWIDDNQMNYSAGTTLNTLCSGTSVPAWCAGAMSYILPNSVIPNTASERP